jgi:hypothetical protein
MNAEWILAIVISIIPVAGIIGEMYDTFKTNNLWN